MATERPKVIRCAVYTRKSSEEGLDQSFNSLEAQREACLAYITSQRQEGWRALTTRYDDGGYSGGTMERPALTQLLADVQAGRLDTVVVYKVDRLTRSLTDFVKIVERFESSGVSFVSVTQQFNTTSSMGRLTLNVLLSFAQFEREVTGERIRDKIAASKQKGMWMGGAVPLGYTVRGRQLVVNPREAARVRLIFRRYLVLKCVRRLQADLRRRGICSKARTSRQGRRVGGVAFARGALYTILKNRLYRGEIAHRGAIYPGQHPAIVPCRLWEAVQVQLAANTQTKRTGAAAKEPSLLAGLLYNKEGQRLVPVHTTKQGTRYRYYVAQPVHQGYEGPRSRLSRLPAYEIEQQVIRHVEQVLANGRTLLDQVTGPTDETATRKALLAGANVWRTLERREPAQLRAFLLATLQRVTVEASQVRIALSRSGLRTVLLRGEATPQVELRTSTVREDGTDTIAVTAKVALTRCGGATRLIVPGDSAGERPVQPNAALIKAVARAHGWSERLMTGKVTSLRAIAREEGVTEGYVGRLLPLTFLAPDLVEAILQGRQPPELTLARLHKHLPLDWAEQREMFGQR